MLLSGKLRDQQGAALAGALTILLFCGACASPVESDITGSSPPVVTAEPTSNTSASAGGGGTSGNTDTDNEATPTTDTNDQATPTTDTNDQATPTTDTNDQATPTTDTNDQATPTTDTNDQATPNNDDTNNNGGLPDHFAGSSELNVEAGVGGPIFVRFPETSRLQDFRGTVSLHNPTKEALLVSVDIQGVDGMACTGGCTVVLEPGERKSLEVSGVATAPDVVAQIDSNRMSSPSR